MQRDKILLVRIQRSHHKKNLKKGSYKILGSNMAGCSQHIHWSQDRMDMIVHVTFWNTFLSKRSLVYG